MAPTPPDDPNAVQQPGFMQRLGTGMLQANPLGNAVYNAFKEPTPPPSGPYQRYNSPSAIPPPVAAAPPAPPVDDSGVSSSWGASAPKSKLTSQLLSKGLGHQSNLADPGAGAAASGMGASPEAGAALGDATAGAAAENIAPSLIEQMGGIAPMFMERGGVVTQPTLVKLAEHGQPEAVVPLTPRPGNRLQPDMLEGHINPPH